MSNDPLINGTPLMPLENLPLVVITGSVYEPNSPTPPSALLQSAQETWLHLQATLLQLSTKSTWIKAAHSGHYVHLDEPNLVIEAIQGLLKSP